MLCGIFSLKCQASQRQTSRRESGKSFGRLCIGLPLPQHAICGVVGRGDYGECLMLRSLGSGLRYTMVTMHQNHSWSSWWIMVNLIQLIYSTVNYSPVMMVMRRRRRTATTMTTLLRCWNTTKPYYESHDFHRFPRLWARSKNCRTSKPTRHESTSAIEGILQS